MHIPVFLLLGSNQGNSVGNLAIAREMIGQQAGKILMVSSLYKSAAWGKSEQPDFYNQVLEITSALPPETLLEKLLDIELQMGRIRIEKWGPRLIDIDLLFYGDEIRNTVALHLPHPGIPERKFTLLPLTEIAPGFVHPVIKKTITTLLAECHDPLMVEKLSSSLTPHVKRRKH